MSSKIGMTALMLGLASSAELTSPWIFVPQSGMAT